MWKRVFTLSIFSMAALGLTVGEALSQPGRGKGGGGRSAGHAAPNAPKIANAGPAMTRPGGAPNLGAKLGIVREAVLARGDTLDGVQDGILENPLLCEFDPGVLQCADADTPDCLTEAGSQDSNPGAAGARALRRNRGWRG